MKKLRKMGKFRKFLKLRKQEDAVKLVLLLFLLGTGLIIHAVYNGVLLYRQIQSPAEYALVKDEAGSGLKEEFMEIGKWEHISAASLYQETELLVKYKEKEASFSCIELSEAYMKAAYGISESGATKTFYMNQKAFEQIESGEADREVSQSSEKERKKLLVTYEITDTDETVADKGEKGRGTAKTAEIILIQENVPEEEPFVFCKGEKPSLEKNGAGIRVFAERQDIDGSNVKKMQSSGFTIENISWHQEAEYLQKIRGIRIRYDVLAAAVCFFSSWALWRFRETEH